MSDGPISPCRDGTRLRVKAVPGASRDAIAGPLGDRLKIRVAAPAEGGKANKAIRALLARSLGMRPADVRIESGHAAPDKTIHLRGVDPGSAARSLGL